MRCSHYHTRCSHAMCVKELVLQVIVTERNYYCIWWRGWKRVWVWWWVQVPLAIISLLPGGWGGMVEWTLVVWLLKAIKAPVGGPPSSEVWEHTTNQRLAKLLSFYRFSLTTQRNPELPVLYQCQRSFLWLFVQRANTQINVLKIRPFESAVTLVSRHFGLIFTV